MPNKYLLPVLFLGSFSGRCLRRRLALRGRSLLDISNITADRTNIRRNTERPRKTFSERRHRRAIGSNSFR